MAKEAVVQIRMDSKIKESAEELYHSLGTSFTEAVRIFAAQSIAEHGFPFIPKAYLHTQSTARGRLSSYASDSLKNKEKDAFRAAMAEKYGKAD